MKINVIRVPLAEYKMQLLCVKHSMWTEQTFVNHLKSAGYPILHLYSDEPMLWNDLTKWCVITFGENFVAFHSTFIFNNEEDITLFKLTWSP